MIKTSDINDSLDANGKFKFLDSLDIDQDVRRRLSINLSNIYSGSDDVFVSPIAKEHGPSKLLSEWDKVFQENKHLMNDVLIGKEENQRTKFGPMSISKPWKERKDGTKSYFENTKIDYSKLIGLLPDRSFKGRFRPMILKEAIKLLKNNTNSGLPFYTRKGKIKSRLLERFDKYLTRKDPCVLFTRTTELRKTRDIWGFPIADTLNEMRFYKPVLEYQKNCVNYRSALNGPIAVDKALTYIIEQAREEQLELISVDFSSYDRSIKPGLQRLVAKYYKYLFQEKYWPEIDYITDRKCTIGLVTPDGVLTGEHGEPSGSTFTNEDDSIAQTMIAMNSGILLEDLYEVQGDDGVYAIRSSDVEKFYDTFKRYGLELNVDKSDRSRDYLVYLQNLYHIDYKKNGIIGGIYPVYRALNRILYQERWSNFEDFGLMGKDYYAIRTISILENCKHHPLFENLVKFILKYDKYGLRPTQQGVKDYIKMINETSGVEGILFNKYGDNVKGLKSFETVKLINSLRGA